MRPLAPPARSYAPPLRSHYVATNGVEDDRQRTPANAVNIASLLIEHGADPDATAGFYGNGEGSTALVALVSSGHPYEAGLQEDLVDVFCGSSTARPDGIGGNGYPMATAFAFFYPGAAEALARNGARIHNIVHAAGLGEMDLLDAWLDDDGQLRPAHGPYLGCYDHVLEDPARILELGLAYAGLAGQLAAVDRLLGAGVDPDAGGRWGETALQLAAFRGHLPVARLLVTRGADTTVRDQRWNSRALGWAQYAARWEVVNYLRERTPPDE